MKRKTKNKIKKIIFYILAYILTEIVIYKIGLLILNNCITTIK